MGDKIEMPFLDIDKNVSLTIATAKISVQNGNFHHSRLQAFAFDFNLLPIHYNLHKLEEFRENNVIRYTRTDLMILMYIVH